MLYLPYIIKIIIAVVVFFLGGKCLFFCYKKDKKALIYGCLCVATAVVYFFASYLFKKYGLM